MQGVRLALYAKLLDLKTVRIIATVLLCNVVAVFALFACQCDLGTDVAGLAHCFLTSLKHNLHVLVYLCFGAVLRISASFACLLCLMP